jgi:hypothetical protein
MHCNNIGRKSSITNWVQSNSNAEMAESPKAQKSKNKDCSEEGKDWWRERVQPLEK